MSERMEPENPFVLTLFVPCLPFSQPRARATIVAGRASMYQPQTTGGSGDRRPHPAVEFRHAVRSAVYAALPDGHSLLGGPIRVTTIYWFPRPASETRKTKPNPPLWHTAKHDIDNLAKGVYDCLNKVVWVDDSQICDTIARKAVVPPGGIPGVRIIIEEIVDGPEYSE